MKHWGALGFGLIFLSMGLFSGCRLIELATVQTGEPSIPEGISNEVIHTPVLPLNQIGSSDGESFIFPYGYTDKIEVDFPDGYSVNGLWSGHDAEFVINSPYEFAFKGETHTDTWPDKLTDEGRSFSPWLKAAFPIEESCNRKWISAKAFLHVVYPKRYDPSHFINKEDRLSRSLKFYVVTPEEYQMLKAHQSWEQFTYWKQNMWIPSFASIFFLFIGVLLVQLSTRRLFHLLVIFSFLFAFLLLNASLTGSYPFGSRALIGYNFIGDLIAYTVGFTISLIAFSIVAFSAMKLWRAHAAQKERRIVIEKQEHEPAKPHFSPTQTNYDPMPVIDRFCHQCGTVVARETKFCPHCGKKLE